MKRRNFLRLTAAYFGLNILKEAAPPPPPPLFNGDWSNFMNKSEGHDFLVSYYGVACPKGHVLNSFIGGKGNTFYECADSPRCLHGSGKTSYQGPCSH